jgi:transposase-like protein
MQSFNPIEDLFKGRHFDRQIIILCVSWYTSFKLSLRDLVIMMADRGICVTHTTILRWAQRYLPEFEKRWRRYARPVGGSWRMDETYIKVHGHWLYLYRAVDKAGQTVDFFLSRNRDVNAAKSFLRSAMKNTRVPTKITLDAYAASHRAVREMKENGELPGSRPGSIQPVLEQSGRAGPSEGAATNPADAGVQAIRQRGGHDLWNRVDREDQEGAVEDGQTRRVQYHTPLLLTPSNGKTVVFPGLFLHHIQLWASFFVPFLLLSFARQAASAETTRRPTRCSRARAYLRSFG